MSTRRKPPPRRFISFSEAQARFPELAEHVVKLDFELVLEREDGKDVALIDASRLQYYKVLEASLTLEDAMSDEPVDTQQEMRPLPDGHAESLPVAMNYYVVNTNVSPREVLERYRVECDLPTKAGPFELSVRVGDELSPETYLATCPGFEPGEMGLAAVMLRAYCIARFGSPELPPPAESYGAKFNQVVLSVVEREPRWPYQAPLFLMSLGATSDGWKVSYAMRSSESDFYGNLIRFSPRTHFILPGTLRMNAG